MGAPCHCSILCKRARGAERFFNVPSPGVDFGCKIMWLKSVLHPSTIMAHIKELSRKYRDQVGWSGIYPTLWRKIGPEIGARLVDFTQLCASKNPIRNRRLDNVEYVVFINRCDHTPVSTLSS